IDGRGGRRREHVGKALRLLHPRAVVFGVELEAHGHSGDQDDEGDGEERKRRGTPAKQVARTHWRTPRAKASSRELSWIPRCEAAAWSMKKRTRPPTMVKWMTPRRWP